MTRQDRDQRQAQQLIDAQNAGDVGGLKWMATQWQMKYPDLCTSEIDALIRFAEKAGDGGWQDVTDFLSGEKKPANAV